MPHNPETSDKTLFSFLIYKDIKAKLEQEAKRKRLPQATIVNMILDETLLSKKEKSASHDTT